MRKAKQEGGKGKAERQQTIVRLIESEPINRQEELLSRLRAEGYELTQATVSRDIREIGLIKVAFEGGYRYVCSRNEKEVPAKNSTRFETIFRESVLSVDFAGHTVVVKCYNGMASAACELFDALNWQNVVGTLSGDDTIFILARTEHDAKMISTELAQYVH